MALSFNAIFSKVAGLPRDMAEDVTQARRITSLAALKEFLDWVHIKHCLLGPFLEHKDYPVVESRALLPSFEVDLFEYGELPGFLMVAFDRQLNYFQEIFQFDRLHDIMELPENAGGNHCPLESNIIEHNLATFRSRLPKNHHEPFLRRFGGKDLCYLENYAALLPFLVNMDRAHVLATDQYGEFHLSGIYASLPADLDAEIKRFGLRIGKFRSGDNCMYERNRLFVYQYLMELYGFPIVSERRTAAALFSRRLFRMGEHFMIRVLGQSDRTITTLWSDPANRHYPSVEKIALVRVDEEQKEAIEILDKGGFFVDRKRRVVILRVGYRQHRFNPNNVRQDRAMSVARQEVIHPITGMVCAEANIVKDATNMILRLTDIVRGEFTGSVTYKRQEVVQDTETHERRLKVLYTWLAKNQRRIIGYSEEFYANVVKVLDSYLLNTEHFDSFNSVHDFYQEVWTRFSYIQQARKVKLLEDLKDRTYKGGHITYLTQLRHMTEIMNELKFEIVHYFPELVEAALRIGDAVLNDRYLIRNYAEVPEDRLSSYGREAKKLYGRLVTLLDEFNSIRKTRRDTRPEPVAVAL